MENHSPSDFEVQPERAAPHYWMQYFGDPAEIARDGDLSVRVSSEQNSADPQDSTDRMLLFRFDDDTTGSCAERGHRILFSALEEDEHPDLVGTDGL